MGLIIKYFAAFLACLFLSTEVTAAQYTGLVIGVTDGDTIKVLDENRQRHTIRLAGIDAPEFKQAFGRVSRQALVEQVAGKNVTVITKKHDRYQREVGKILLVGSDVNLLQIELGMAWYYRSYQRELSKEDRRLYDEAENSAQSAKRGLWRDPHPQSPWDYRQQKKS